MCAPPLSLCRLQCHGRTAATAATSAAAAAAAAAPSGVRGRKQPRLRRLVGGPLGSSNSLGLQPHLHVPHRTQHTLPHCSAGRTVPGCCSAMSTSCPPSCSAHASATSSGFGTALHCASRPFTACQRSACDHSSGCWLQLRVSVTRQCDCVDDVSADTESLRLSHSSQRVSAVHV